MTASTGDDPANVARAMALSIYQAVLDAVRADALVAANLALDGDRLRVGDTTYSLSPPGRVVLLGAGKAACGMATAAVGVLGTRLTSAVVVTKRGYGVTVPGVVVLEAGHPVPDEGSVVAGDRILGELRGLGDQDLVLFLLSGGASALLERPSEGLTLGDLREVTGALLRSGAPIEEINAVRSCLSDIKAGGIARAASPARVVCLVLSDVLGNPLDVIGSGPCIDREPDGAAAAAVLKSRRLWEAVPSAVRRRLDDWEGRGGRVVHPAQHVIVGDIHTAVDAAVAAARTCGLEPRVLTDCLTGEARDAGDVLGMAAADLASRDDGINCLVAAGETTVTVVGDGLGGRCQELAASAALRMGGVRGIALLAAGTDGSDGPTDAAGAIVDGATASIPADLHSALATSDTYPALDRLGAILRTGSTESNVGDVVIVVRAGEGR